LSKISKTLSEYLSDGNSPSCSRLLTFITVPLLTLLPLFCWVYMCISTNSLIDFPTSLAGFVVPIVTVILGHEHLNKREEVKTEIKELEIKK